MLVLKSYRRRLFHYYEYNVGTARNAQNNWVLRIVILTQQHRKIFRQSASSLLRVKLRLSSSQSQSVMTRIFCILEEISDG